MAVRTLLKTVSGIATLSLLGVTIASAEIKPADVKQGDAVVRNFKFGDGETIPALKMHYRTLGTPHRGAGGQIDNAVLILHSSGSEGSQFLKPAFAGELFGPGQPLDLAKFYVILPDAIGHGGSSKPSDGLQSHFPHFDYDDIVVAEKTAFAQDLGITHYRLIMGTSLGCGTTFLWAVRFPKAASAYMPLACIPAEVSGQNRVWRRAAIEAIKADPAWQGGLYRTPPVLGLRTAVSVQMIAAGIGPWAMQRDYPTKAAADTYFDQRFARDMATIDANDLMYQLEASGHYDPSPLLDRVAVPMTWINFGDDVINLPGSKYVADLAARIPNTRFVLIPRTEETRGHSTHSLPHFWKQELIALLARSEPAAAK
jgi:homoserine O-acetyltransferase